jgi:two-component system osmolarity sensor histidine kinase EnvZ
LRARLGPQATVALDPGNDELWIRAPSTAGRWARLPVELPLRQILIRTTLAAALGLLVTMALAMWLAGRTTRPLRNLAQWAEGDGTGDVPQTSAAQAGIEAAQLSAALARLQSRLDAASREREVVLAGISHDLRTPLTRLRLRLAMEQLAPATMLEIDREIDELDSIVEQFVAYARGVDAEPQLRTALDPLVRAAAPADGTVLLDLRSSRRVHVRAGAIARIVTNLLDNARRHGRTPIELRTYDDGDGVMLAVRDHGPGISPEDAARAQAPFVRLHNDRTRVGTGLGLAIVARLAAADGGRVHLHQVAGEYFEVQLRWPA